MPHRVVEILPYKDALVLADQVGVEVELAVVQLEAEVGVALADGHEAVAKRGPELHGELIALLAVGRDLDVRVAG